MGAAFFKQLNEPWQVIHRVLELKLDDHEREFLKPYVPGGYYALLSQPLPHCYQLKGAFPTLPDLWRLRQRIRVEDKVVLTVTLVRSPVFAVSSSGDISERHYHHPYDLPKEFRLRYSVTSLPSASCRSITAHTVAVYSLDATTADKVLLRLVENQGAYRGGLEIVHHGEGRRQHHDLPAALLSTVSLSASPVHQVRGFSFPAKSTELLVQHGNVRLIDCEFKDHGRKFVASILASQSCRLHFAFEQHFPLDTWQWNRLLSGLAVYDRHLKRRYSLTLHLPTLDNVLHEEALRLLRYSPHNILERVEVSCQSLDDFRCVQKLLQGGNGPRHVIFRGGLVRGYAGFFEALCAASVERLTLTDPTLLTNRAYVTLLNALPWLRRAKIRLSLHLTCGGDNGRSGGHTEEEQNLHHLLLDVLVRSPMPQLEEIRIIRNVETTSSASALWSVVLSPTTLRRVVMLNESLGWLRVHPPLPSLTQNSDSCAVLRQHLAYNVDRQRLRRLRKDPRRNVSILTASILGKVSNDPRRLFYVLKELHGCLRHKRYRSQRGNKFTPNDATKH